MTEPGCSVRSLLLLLFEDVVSLSLVFAWTSVLVETVLPKREFFFRIPFSGRAGEETTLARDGVLPTCCGDNVLIPALGSILLLLLAAEDEGRVADLGLFLRAVLMVFDPVSGVGGRSNILAPGSMAVLSFGLG